MTVRIQLIADGDIPTTAIVAQALRRGFAQEFLPIHFADDMAEDILAEAPILFSRVLDPRWGWLPRFIRRHRGRYAYFLDDNFWECNVSEELAAYYGDPLRREALENYLRYAAVVIVNSAFLADEVRRRVPGAHVVVIPAHFDFDLLPSAATHRVIESHVLRIGFAGTTRGRAFAPVAEAIERLLRDFPGQVEFEFIGYVPTELKDIEGVRSFPVVPGGYKAFLEFKQARHWDVGLAPLQDDLFSRAKTNNKFREYGALAIAGIYSDVEPYRGTVEDGKNGLLVEGDGSAWYRAISRFVEDPALAASIGQAARATVARVHDVRVVAETWRSALESANVCVPQRSIAISAEWMLHKAVARQRLRLHEWRRIARQQGTVALLRHVISRFGSGSQ